jgi:hypothetical protein
LAFLRLNFWHWWDPASRENGPGVSDVAVEQVESVD